MSGLTLKERALRVREHAAFNQELHRPVIVEFTGSPDAGKTTAIEAVRNFFRRLGYAVQKPQEGAEIFHSIPRSDPEFNIRTGIYQMSLVIDAKYDRNTDLVILDRGLYDPYYWMSYWTRKGALDIPTARAWQQFFTHEKWRSSIDTCFFMTCDAQEVVRRNEATIPLEDLGETTNPESVRMLVDLARDAYVHWDRKGAPVHLLDTTFLRIKDANAFCIERTLQVFEQRFTVPTRK